jgi:long-chain acyl-CoA synthetase
MTLMTQAALQNETIPCLFAATVAARGDQDALGVIESGALRWIVWRQLAAKVEAWAAELAARGIQPGMRVAQLSPNCEGWILADLAIQSIGAVHVPLHVALSPQQVAEQIAHSGARLLILWPGFSEIWNAGGKLPTPLDIITHDDFPHDPPPLKGGARGGISEGSSAATNIETSRPANPSPQLSHQGSGVAPDDLATILYTSGTTGSPRGVMLTQRAIVANASALADALDTGNLETRLLILPLSHIYARTCDLYVWTYRGSRMVIAESRETALRDCQLARPTTINAVPYFYQKVADAVAHAGAVGWDKVPPAPQQDSALQSILGGTIKRLFCGGAGLSPQVEQFFDQHGLPILCGYGLTESAPVITASTLATYSPGSVGRPLPNVEVQLADDGEILARGPSLMQGYWKNADETTRMLRDGWLHTGDLGEWDARGNLRIVGRKKEMIVLATGKKVAPTRIEQLLVGSRWIEQCCVLGDGHKCVAALIVPQPDALRDYIKRERLFVWSRRRALTHPKVRALYRQEIDRCLADAAEFEQVGCFTLLGRGFSVELGEMTPKLSLCRKVIEKNFVQEIEAMYKFPLPRREGLREGLATATSLPTVNPKSTESPLT